MKIRVQQEISPFPVTVITVGKDILQKAINRQSGFAYDQLFYISDGTGYLKLPGGIYELNKGDFFYLTKNEPHSYGPKNDSFKTNWLCFDCSCTNDIASFYGINKSTYFFNNNKGKFQAKHHAIHRDFYNLDDAQLSSSAYSAIVTFFREVSNRKDNELKVIENYLIDNYSKPISLDELVKIYGHSKSKLCSTFKKEYGMSIFEKLMCIRLDYANLFLQTNPSLTLNDIARLTGFTDASYFCKIYKKYYGTSPKAGI